MFTIGVPSLPKQLAVVTQTLTASERVSNRRQFLAAICICLCSALNALGQSEQNAQFTQGNPGTNTMTFQIPLGSFPGRGVDLPLNLNYNSKVWRIGFLKTRYWTANGKNSVTEANYSEFATAGCERRSRQAGYGTTCPTCKNSLSHKPRLIDKGLNNSLSIIGVQELDRREQTEVLCTVAYQCASLSHC